MKEFHEAVKNHDLYALPWEILLASYVPIPSEIPSSLKKLLVTFQKAHPRTSSHERSCLSFCFARNQVLQMFVR